MVDVKHSRTVNNSTIESVNGTVMLLDPLFFNKNGVWIGYTEHGIPSWVIIHRSHSL